MKNIFTKTIILCLFSLMFTISPNVGYGQPTLKKIKEKVTSIVNKIRRRAPREAVVIPPSDSPIATGSAVNPFSPDVVRQTYEAEFLSDQLVYNKNVFEIIDQIWRNRLYTAESENAGVYHELLTAELRKAIPQLRIDKDLNMDEYALLHEIAHLNHTALSERHIIKLNEFVAHPKVTITGGRTNFDNDREFESRIE